MSYTGDDDDDYADGDASVDGPAPGELAGGFTNWPSLRQRPGHWSSTLKRNQAKAGAVGGPTNVEGQDELQWGNRVTRPLFVPPLAAPGMYSSASGFATNNFTQLVQLRRPARVWTLIYNLEWTNPGAVILTAGETLFAFFSIYLGVGSSRIRIARDLAIAGPSGTPVFPQFGVDATFVDANLAAAEVVISVNAAVNTPGGFITARTFNLLLSAHAAPVSR